MWQNYPYKMRIELLGKRRRSLTFKESWKAVISCYAYCR